MKHVSKFDGYEYEISYSVADEDGCPKYDDIILIWRDAPCGVGNAYLENISPRELVGWYWGEYDFETAEEYIKEYWKKKLGTSEQQPKSNPSKTLGLPICYVHLIEDCLRTIQDHNLYELIDSYDKDEESIEHLKRHIKDVINDFCKPLDELDVDTEIIIEEN